MISLFDSAHDKEGQPYVVGLTMSSEQVSSRDVSKRGAQLNKKTYIKVGEIEVNDQEVQNRMVNGTKEEETSERAETENIAQRMQTSECVSGYNQGQADDHTKYQNKRASVLTTFSPPPGTAKGMKLRKDYVNSPITQRQPQVASPNYHSISETDLVTDQDQTNDLEYSPQFKRLYAENNAV